MPAGPILSADEVVRGPQILHSGTLIEWEHPDGGVVRRPRSAARLAKTPAVPRPLGAHRGQHTDEILAEIGRSADDIAALRRDGIIG